MRVLIVEDDIRLSSWVARGLTESGHRVDAVPDGRDALMCAMGAEHDVLVVDRMLPRLDGVSLVKALRAANVRTPVLLLSALGAVEQRVEGLDAGADDYLVKPFVFSELLARVAALGRRPVEMSERTLFRVGDLELDLVRRSVRRSGDTLRLMPREFGLLEALARGNGRVVTRTALLEQVWGYRFEPNSSIVETYVSRLRDKIDRPYARELVHTVRGRGYSLHDDED